MYRVVRVNNDDHPDRPSAMADMRSIIERGFYWKMSGDVEIPYGTPIIAVGCYGGAGLFLLGICNGEWGDEPQAAEGGGRWHRRIPVVWQPVIYTFGTNHNSGKASVKKVASMLSKYNIRFGAEAKQDEFRKVMDFVLSGKAIYPSIRKKAAA
jgi:hypothetical protein